MRSMIGVTMVAMLVGAVALAKSADVSASVPLEVAKDAGLVPSYSVYKIATFDGGSKYTAFAKLPDGGIAATDVDSSPCRKRPTGVKASTCLSVVPDGGTREQGDENVMQSGQWVGAGCVESACVAVFGETP